jgi:ABC-type branched-subunit amino acid transport system substrate-binding protein
VSVPSCSPPPPPYVPPQPGGRRRGAGGAGRAAAALLIALLLPPAACAPQPPPPPAFGLGPAPGAGYPALAPALPAGPPRARVGLLLPLSGGARSLGEAMLNAAQLALFDQADPRVELLPRDTGGSPTGAMEAARSALAEGARAFAGPLTLGETAAAAGVARAAGAPLMAFTSDATQAAPGTWVLGVTPQEQVDRVVGAAAARGAARFGLLAPDDEFGRRLAAALRARLTALGLPPPVVQLRAPRGDPSQAARDLAGAAGPEGLDAVLLGEGGERARAAATALAAALPRPARLLGTTLWLQDGGGGGAGALAQEPALAGAWFPGPDPAARQRFEARYQAAFGTRPPRLAGVAYDAAALAARTVRDGGGAAPPVGEALMGADGPIRLLADGQARRGLALLALDPSGEPALVEPAPLPAAAGS